MNDIPHKISDLRRNNNKIKIMILEVILKDYRDICDFMSCRGFYRLHKTVE